MSACGIIITTGAAEEHSIIYANPYFQALTGYSESEIIGKNCSFLQGPDSDSKVIRQINLALKSGKVFEGVILNYRKDGSTFWNQLILSPIKDPAGTPIFYIGIQKEITECVEATAGR